MRRRPEWTLLYQLVAEHYPRFRGLLADQGRSLPDYVRGGLSAGRLRGLWTHHRVRLSSIGARGKALAVSGGHLRAKCLYFS